MESQASTKDYIIWGIDDSTYGPVELSVLIEWIKDERVLPESWIFARKQGIWQKASEIGELKDFFKTELPPVSVGPTVVSFKPGALRRIKILAKLNDAQLAHLSDFLEYQPVLQHAQVVKQGEPGDAMYLIMSGELRARTMVGGRETILMTLGTGEFFGEMSLFDQGPRSADVVANVDSSVLRLTAASPARCRVCRHPFCKPHPGPCPHVSVPPTSA